MQINNRSDRVIWLNPRGCRLRHCERRNYK